MRDSKVTEKAPFFNSILPFQNKGV